MLPHIKRTNNTNARRIPGVDSEVLPAQPLIRDKKREFGDYRYDYITSCRHDIQSIRCPICKIADKFVELQLSTESGNERVSREASGQKRGVLRLCLLKYWARNQLSYMSDISEETSVEITLSTAMVDSIMKTESSEIDYIDFIRLLERRRRILEVGQYAAMFLQARIRKFLCRRRVRVELLQRFEYIPARDETHRPMVVDTLFFKNRGRLPRLLGAERPATPKTIERRLNFEARLQQSRLQTFRRALTHAYKDGDIWDCEAQFATRMRQLIVLRDVIASAMLATTRSNVHGIKNHGSDVAPVPGSLEALQQELDTDTLTEKAEIAHLQEASRGHIDNSHYSLPENRYKPVVMSVSAPGPSQRQLSIYLALQTPQYNPAQHNRSSATRSRERKRNVKGDGVQKRANDMSISSSSGGTTTETIIPGTASATVYNKALKELELRAFNSLKCSSPEDVVMKLCGCKELHSAFVGIVELASDESGVWKSSGHFQAESSASNANIVISNGDNVTGGASRSLSSPASPSMMDFANSLNVSAGEHNENRHRVLPSMATMATMATMAATTNTSIGGEGVKGKDLSAKMEVSSSQYATIGMGGVVNRVAHTNDSDGDSDSDGSDSISRRRRMLLNPEQQVLPMSIQLKAVKANYGLFGPQCVFRLFFFEGELVAVTPTSPWTFYSEIPKEKDAILAAVLAYVATPELKDIVRNYYYKANPRSGRRSSVSVMGSSVSASRRGSRRGSAAPVTNTNVDVASSPTVQPGKRGSLASAMAAAAAAVAAIDQASQLPHPAASAAATALRRNSVHLPEVSMPFQRRGSIEGTSHPSGRSRRPSRTDNASSKKGGCISVYVPPESLIFDNRAPYMAMPPNNYDRTLALNEKYKFLHKMSLWKDTYKRAQMNRSKLNKPTISGDLSSVSDINNAKLLLANTDNRDLIGAEVYRLHSFDHVDVAGSRSSTSAGSKEYINKLIDISTKTDTSILRRTDPSKVFASAKQKSVQEPRFDLLVIDVCIPPRKTGRGSKDKDKDRDRNSRGRSADTTSTNAGTSTNDGLSAPAQAQVPTTEKIKKTTDARTDMTAAGHNHSTIGGTSTSTADGSSLGVGPVDKSTATNITSTNARVAELHQVVGIYSCGRERAPTNIDFGLFDWPTFRNMRQEFDRRQVEIGRATRRNSNSNINVSSDVLAALASFNMGTLTGTGTKSSAVYSDELRYNDPRTKYRAWSVAITSGELGNGVSTYKLFVAPGIDFQFKIIAAQPSKEYLEAHLPARVKAWIGMM